MPLDATVVSIIMTWRKLIDALGQVSSLERIVTRTRKPAPDLHVWLAKYTLLEKMKNIYA